MRQSNVAGLETQRRRLGTSLFPLRLVLLGVPLVLAWCATSARAQSTPTRWNAGYTPIYSDNVETLSPALGSAFSLTSAGSLTSDPAEVISGTRSIKGSYSGANAYTGFLTTAVSALTFLPSHTYQITFQYKILTAAAKGFNVVFYSPTANSQNISLPVLAITGSAGTTGTPTLTATIGSFTDYVVLWGIVGAGAISIDNVQITDTTVGKVVASENAEGTAPVLKPGLQLQNSARITTDPAQVVDGTASVRLTNNGTVVTNPAIVPLGANTTYIFQLQYRVIKTGSANQMLNLRLQPAGPTSTPQNWILPESLFFNAPTTGTFSAGAQTSTSTNSWILYISASSDSDIVVDDIAIFRQDATPSTLVPPTWSKLSSLPYPRLGQYILSTTVGQAVGGGAAEGPPYRISVDEVEKTLAFADVIAGLNLTSQTQSPSSIRRLRALNPNAVILPYRIFVEQQTVQAPTNSGVDPNYDIFQGIASDWYIKTAEGNPVVEVGYPSIGEMNISQFCPMVSGQTYSSYIVDQLNNRVFNSGIWDGIFFDNLIDQIGSLIPNYLNPAAFDFDWNRNGIRDETPASTSDMTRAGAISILQNLRNTVGNLQLVTGNSGPAVEPSLAPYVNGFFLECTNAGWGAPVYTSTPTTLSPAGWRMVFDTYRTTQPNLMPPQINVIQACGPYAHSPGTGYSTPTANDLQTHRFTMGTALLLSGAFYGFALHGSLSAPLWMDEYSVDSTGTAIQDMNAKGYLGQPLTDATELTTGGSLVFQETFPGTNIPSSFSAFPGTSVSVTNGTLVIGNPSHTAAGFGAGTNTGVLKLSPGNPYLLTFDWTILDTLDTPFFAAIGGNGPQPLDFYTVPRTVTGDSGTARLPFVIPAAGQWTVYFANARGGGRFGISNVRITSGGAGPWRRDFENGFVLVNPFLQPHTFSAVDLAGALNRTNIHRINGTQATDINNGQPVTDSLTLAPFDSIILLADPITVPGNVGFRISDRGGTSQTTSGAGSAVQVGFARIIPYEGTTPSGMAIFDFRQNGVLISEAAVPASPLIQNGRTYAEIAGPVDTGIAIANPNSQDAMFYFYYTDATGASVLSGAVPVPANTQISAFLDQAPFISQPTDLSMVRAFTFASSLPLGVVALRGYTNERGEFLITTLPIDPLTTTSNAAFAFPHYADGGGWTSALVLVNPTDATITGTAQFYSKGSATTAGAPVTLTANGASASSFSYTIAPRSSFKLQTAGSSSSVQTGWVQITPTSGSVSPSGLVVFSFASNGVRVSEAGVPAQPSSTAFRMYAEASGSIETGIAISNPATSNVIVNFDLTNLDGSSTGLTGTTTVPATGQVSMFLNQIPGFSSLPASFKGVLRISGANVFVTGLRGRYNERGDFLITTTAPVDETAPASISEMVFPQLADGGGYTTQIILFSGTAGQSGSGVLQFVSQSGQPLILSLQ